MPYFKNGDSYYPITDESLNLQKILPGATFIVQFDINKNSFFLEKVDNLIVPTQVYGDSIKNCKRIFNTFLERDQSTGVLLSGEKGSGKTLLAKLLSVTGLKEGIPTIIINKEWNGDLFNKFIQDIEQPTIILFDEFEKIYDREKQEKILTLLDGVFPTKKMFVFTCNDKWRIDQHMSNRPGRIFYMIEYGSIDPVFITEYCEDNLKNKDHISQVCSISATFENFNFDILKSLVEEMNRYDETAFEAIKLLNATPMRERSGAKYTIDLSVNNIRQKKAGWRNYYDSFLTVNPISLSEIEIEYLDENDECFIILFSREEMINVDSLSGKFAYKNGNGDILILTRVVESKFDLSSFTEMYAF